METVTKGTNATQKKIYLESEAINYRQDVVQGEPQKNLPTKKTEELDWNSITKETLLPLLIIFSATDSGTKRDHFWKSLTRCQKQKSIEEKIESVYAEIKETNKKLSSVSDGEKLKEKLDKLHDQLETLQNKEAQLFEQKFRDSLKFPMGSGRETLNDSRKLLEDDEDSPAPNESP